MIAKWDIQPIPEPKNRDRHKLLVKGDMTDIFFIVKKLGKICSRPEKSKGDFNFIIYLSKMDMEIMTKLKQVTGELSKIAKKDASQSSEEKTKPIEKSVAAEQAMMDQSVAKEAQVKAEKAKEEEAKAAKAKEEQAQAEKAKEEEAKAAKVKEEQAQAEKAKEEEAKVAKAKEEEAKAAKVKEEQAQAEKAKKEQAAKEEEAKVAKAKEEQAQAAKVKEEQAQAEKEKEQQASSPSSSTRMRGMSIPSRKNKQQLGKPEEKTPAQESSGEAEKAESGRRKKKLLQTRWSMELPMIPTYNFENFIAGSHNRFAHAAAMAVIDNPGTMYNPLLIFGIPGTGKTHFTYSIAYGLANSLGQRNIFVTDGIKLSRGLDLAIRDGLTNKLEEIFKQAKALVIDDVHLLMLAEGNKKFLSKLLNDFMSKDKQIVVTSLFPPKALGGLEDQLGFQLTQGWMVDLKIPNAEKYKAIVTKMMDSVDIKLDEKSINKFFLKNFMALGDVVETFEQVKKLEKLIASMDNRMSHAQLLQMLLGDSSEDSVLLEDDINKAEAFKLKTKDNWFKWGIFYSKGCQNEAKWIIYSLYEKSKELGINVEWDQVFIEEYNSDESYGVPFKIADVASEKKANGIIIMGPQSTSVLGAQEQEFKHLSSKILTSFFIKSSWIKANKIKDSASYVKILMDLI
ncbi:MAG: ATP-binding protein [Elusimicrobia bacterium]|nr:ATP-binding protein [Elusimicrobiota bacterium]